MSVERVLKQVRGSSVPIEIPQPQFHKVKNKEKRKMLEDLYSNINVRRPGERNRHVKIDNTSIDLYRPESEVADLLVKAMEIEPTRADYAMTEKMIDEIQARNETEKSKEGIFTSTLERFINNVGRKLPHDSHALFYRDHYDREVKLRGGILDGKSTNSIVNSDFKTARESAQFISMTDVEGDSPSNLNQNSGNLYVSQTVMSG